METSRTHRNKLYGRRKGPKLSQYQASLFQTLLPALELKLVSGCDPRAYFEAAVDDVWLEIGFGGGEHLQWQAAHHPHTGIIGAEPYETGVAKLLAKLAAAYSADAAHSIRIYRNDARDIVEALPDASLGRVFILFPDPWPKTRHHKRRFIQMTTLDELARVLKPGAELRFASDDTDYVAWVLERVLAHPSFEWTATSAVDWNIRPSDWPPTRYEEKALHGAPIFLKFLRT
ncbi:MAG: tRNA (guanine(46)-N(7))-methyltransferase TrmB [Rhizomicrobium sp.]|jgi:tRNA (guanine-N7-)-methyltransferase